MLDGVLALNGLDTRVFDATTNSGSARADSAEFITVPDAHLLFSGDFKRVGTNDLKIVGDDGYSFFIENYFGAEKRATLMSPEGALMSPSTVDALAGPLAPGQYAQAGAQPASQPVIGRVDAVSGSATVVRNGVTVTLNVGDTVRKGDVVQTSGGSSVAIVLADGSTFSLNANARMVLDDFVYSQGGANNSALVSLVQGTFSFVAGQVAKTGDMRVDTPVATMGIRGTAVLVEISANDGRTRFSVMLEPDGTTGSFNLYNKATGTLIGTVNNSQVGWVVTPAGPLQVVAQQVQKTPGELQQELGIVQQIFTIFNNNQQNPFTPQDSPERRGDTPDNSNPQTAQGSGSGTQFTVNLPTNTPTGTGNQTTNPVTVTVTPVGQTNTTPTTPTNTPDPTTPGTTPLEGSDLTTLDFSGHVPPPVLHIQGNAGNDYIIGSNYDDEIDAGSGNDFVFSGLGNDVIIAGHGGGNDYYDGGAGHDKLTFTSANGVTFNLNYQTVGGVKQSTAVSIAQDAAHNTGTDVFVNIEEIVASPGNDIFILNDAGDWLIDAGAGIDIVRFANGLSLNNTPGGPEIYNFEIVDLATDTATNVVDFDVADLDDLGNSVPLRILAGGNDVLNISNKYGLDGTWTKTQDNISANGVFTDGLTNGVLFDVYTWNFGGKTQTVYVQDGTAINQVPVFGDPVINAYGSFVLTEHDGRAGIKLTTGQGAIEENTLEDLLDLSTIVEGSDAINSVTPGEASPTLGSAVSFEFHLQQGQAVGTQWRFDTDDYMPWNDFAFVAVTLNGVTTITRLSSVSTVGNYGDSGWQFISFVAQQTGTYYISFGVMDVDDGAYNSNLYVANPGLALKPVIEDVYTLPLLGEGGEGGTEGPPPAPVLTTSLVVPFSDADAGDVHTATAVLDGSNPLGSVEADVFVGEGLRQVTLTYSVENAAVQHLGKGQTLTQTIKVTLSDGDGFVERHYTVTIVGANDAPSITIATGDSGSATLTETNAGLAASGTLTAFDVDQGDQLTVSVVGIDVDGAQGELSDAQLLGFLSVNAGTLASGGKINWVFNSGPNAFDHLPAGQSMILHYFVQINDGTAVSQHAVHITIDGTNDGPVASFAADEWNGKGNEDDSFIAVRLSGSDVDGSISGYRLLSLPQNGWLYTDFSGGVLIDDLRDLVASGDKTVYFKPNGDWNGTTSFTFAAIDNSGALSANTATATVTVAARNDAPTVAHEIPDASVDAASTLNFTFAANTFADIDSPTLTYSATLANGDPLPDWLTFDPATRSFSGTAPYVELGGETLSITVTATDGALATASDTFDIDIAYVTPPNFAPRTIAQAEVRVATEDPANPVMLRMKGNDDDGYVDDIRIVTVPANGTLYSDFECQHPIAAGDLINAPFQSGEPTGQITIFFRPAANFNGQVSFQYAAVDDLGLQDPTPETFAIDVVPVPDGVTFNVIGGTGSFAPTPVAVTPDDVAINDPASDPVAGSRQSEAEVTVLPDGRVFAVYEGRASNTSGDFDVYGRLFSADGVPLTEPFAINPESALTQKTPSVTTLADGSAVVTWQSWNPSISNYETYAQRITFDAQSHQPVFAQEEFRIGSGGQDNTTVQALGNGFIAIWQTWTGADYDVLAQRYSGAGLPIDEQPFRVHASASGLQTNPSVATYPDGSFIVVWQEGSSNADIYGRRFAADGNPTGEQFLIDNPLAGAAANAPHVVTLANGGFVVAWDVRYASGVTDVRFQVFDANGVEVGSEVVTNAANLAENTNNIVALSDGTFVVAWRESPGADWTAVAQRYNADGTPLGDRFTINDATPIANFNLPSGLAATANGGFVATFASVIGGIDYDSSMRIFSAADVMQGNEDTTLTLRKLDVGVVESSETAKLVITGFPAGTVFSVNGQPVGGLQGPINEERPWVISNPADIAALKDHPLQMTPPANFNGQIELQVSAVSVDSADLSTETVIVNSDAVTKTLLIDVKPVNDAPVAGDDNAGSTAEDAPKTIAVSTLTANDSDVETAQGSLTVTAVGNATGGLAAIHGSNIVFTPTAGFSGQAAFDYTVSDGQGGTDTARVTLDVAPVADAPIFSFGFGTRDIIVNGGFENGLTGWANYTSQTGGAHNDGINEFSATGLREYTVPLGSTPTTYYLAGPAAGNAYALFYHDTITSGAIEQDFTLPYALQSVTISYNLFVLNRLDTAYIGDGELNNVSPNGLHFGRVDLVTTSAGWNDVTPGSAVLDNLFLGTHYNTPVTFPASYPAIGWTPYSFTAGGEQLIALNGGGSYALRFAEVATWQNPLHMGIDNVAVTVTAGAGGVEDTDIVIGRVGVADTDGSEQITKLVLSGFVAGAVFKINGVVAGGVNGDGHWVIDNATQLAALATTDLKMTPPADWNGTFTLHSVATVVDTATLSTGAASDTRTFTNDVTVEVVPANEIPTTNNVTTSGAEDEGPIEIVLSGNDTDGSIAGFKLTSLPLNGLLYGDSSFSTALDDDDLQQLLSASGGTRTLYFVPNENFNGSVSFQYVAVDNEGGQDASPATASITVTPVADPASLQVLTSGGFNMFLLPVLFGAGISEKTGSSFRLINLQNDVVVTGTDLTYDASGFPGGGTITGMTIRSTGQVPLAQISGLEIDGEMFGDAIAPGASQAQRDALGSAFNQIQQNLYGGDGNDVLSGGNVVDHLYGGDGSDNLVGNGGNDILHGGAGADFFQFKPADGNDTVQDFALDIPFIPGEQNFVPGDRLVFQGYGSNIDFTDLAFSDLSGARGTVITVGDTGQTVTLLDINRASIEHSSGYFFFA